MYDDYFVLLTEDFFGVFKTISPGNIPNELPNKLTYIRKVPSGEIKKFLIDKVGINILINKNFQLPFSIGKLYSRQPS